MRDHRPKAAEDILSEHQAFQLHQHAARLAQLNTLVQRVIPELARPHCRVANYRQGILIIECSSATWLTRLNYQRTELLSLLRKANLSSLTTIEFKVNPSFQSLVRDNHYDQFKPKKSVISHQSAQYLQSIANDAPQALKKRLEAIAALTEFKK